VQPHPTSSLLGFSIIAFRSHSSRPRSHLKEILARSSHISSSTQSLCTYSLPIPPSLKARYHNNAYLYMRDPSGHPRTKILIPSQVQSSPSSHFRLNAMAAYQSGPNRPSICPSPHKSNTAHHVLERKSQRKPSGRGPHGTELRKHMLK